MNIGRRKLKRPLLGDGEAYRDLIERSDDLHEDIPELDVSKKSDEQIRLYQQASEDAVRDGRL